MLAGASVGGDVMPCGGSGLTSRSMKAPATREAFGMASDCEMVM
jgi:hypothetical protein